MNPSIPPSPTLPTATTDYTTAYNSYGYKYDPQTAEINTALAAIPGQTQTALSSLDQAKANAFKTIGTNANANGVLFSGYSPEMQSEYTTNTYNPNVQKVNTAAATDQTNLQQKLTDLNNARAVDAASLVQNTQQAQAQAAAEAAKEAAAASAAAQPSASQAKQSFSNSSLAYLTQKAGGDGHISPETYASEAIKWLNAGYSISDFNSAVNSAKLLNPTNGYYSYALTEALKRGQ